MRWEKIETARMITDPGLFGATSNINVLLSRAQAPGGGLVVAATAVGAAYPVSVTFYPDPTHAWDAGSSQER